MTDTDLPENHARSSEGGAWLKKLLFPVAYRKLFQPGVELVRNLLDSFHQIKYSRMRRV